MIEQLNSLNKNVWAILLVLIGAGMAWASTFNKDLLQPALLIIGGGLAIFEGRSGGSENMPAKTPAPPAPVPVPAAAPVSTGSADNPDA